MTKRPLVFAALAALAVAGCAPNPTANPTTPGPTTTLPPITAPPTSPEPTPSPSPDAHLPDYFLVVGPVFDDARRVVRELQRVSGGLPALKLDIGQGHVTLSVLTPDDAVRTYRWRDDKISLVDSDVQYVGQATFRPEAFPLDSVRRIFDIASMVSGSSSNQVLQIVEFRTGKVFMSVTTQPETRAVFFEQDGTILRELGFSSVDDITAGLAEVTAGDDEVTAVGFSPNQGYWAEVALPGGIIERRTRMGALPLFSVQHTATTDLAPVPVELLDPAAIAKSLAEFRSTPEDTCAVVIDDRFGRVQPVIQYTCPGGVFYTDMQGRNMTAELG